jgi:hypothetical protein
MAIISTTRIHYDGNEISPEEVAQKKATNIENIKGLLGTEYKDKFVGLTHLKQIPVTDLLNLTIQDIKRRAINNGEGVLEDPKVIYDRFPSNTIIALKSRIDNPIEYRRSDRPVEIHTDPAKKTNPQVC